LEKGFTPAVLVVLLNYIGGRVVRHPEVRPCRRGECP